LLGCGWKRAKELAGDWNDTRPIGSFDLATQVHALDDEPEDRRPQVMQYPPSHFGRVRDGSEGFNYLLTRRFKPRHVLELCRLYDIRYAYEGRFAGRIILPFLGPKYQCYGWQGRAINAKAEVRYLAYPSSDRAKRLLYNFGPAYQAKDRRVLAIVEGPIDALKVDFYGQLDGIRSVGTLGTAFMPSQVALLYRLCALYDRTLILFDRGAEGAAFDLSNRLSSFSPVIGYVPEGTEDAGALLPQQVVPVVRACL
jgi:hypothetical protein